MLVKFVSAVSKNSFPDYTWPYSNTSKPGQRHLTKFSIRKMPVD